MFSQQNIFFNALIETYMSKHHKKEQMERYIALEKVKLEIHEKKWKKYLKICQQTI